jgi:hypothetical protein
MGKHMRKLLLAVTLLLFVGARAEGQEKGYTLKKNYVEFFTSGAIDVLDLSGHLVERHNGPRLSFADLSLWGKVYFRCGGVSTKPLEIAHAELTGKDQVATVNKPFKLRLKATNPLKVNVKYTMEVQGYKHLLRPTDYITFTKRGTYYVNLYAQEPGSGGAEWNWLWISVK